MTTSGAIKKTFVAYINGYKMWPRSVNVTATVGSLLEFNLEFPAIEEWDVLPARSHCVIFFIDPVTKKWRMLCEGEYVGFSKTRASSGSRTRYLTFRGLHGTLQSSTYVSYGGIAKGTAVENAVLIANGRRIAASSAEDARNIDVFSLDQLIDTMSQSGRISALFDNLMRAVLLQLPVEGFYLYYRKLMQKTFAFVDHEATSILRLERFTQIAKTMASPRAHDNKSVLSILREFEATVLYQHYPMLCPPIYGKPTPSSGDAALTPADGASRIPELVFSPRLYSVIPPACNVFFEDQMTSQSAQRNFVMEPSRIILQIQSGQLQIPNVYMANSLDTVADITELTNRETYAGQDPGKIVPGINLSQEEMLRGVVPQSRPFNFEKLAREAAKTEAPNDEAAQQLNAQQYALYCTVATQHHFAMARGEHRPASIVCAFHPYAVAGVPALVEDRGGSFHGIVQSVTHTLSNDSPPFTTVSLTHTRAAQVIEDTNATPPNPSWLNSYYLPRQIAGQVSPEDPSGSGGTWGKLLGPNAWPERNGTYRTAMVTDEQIIADLNAGTSVKNDATLAGEKVEAAEQVDMDRLASKVLPVPRYTAELEFQGKSTGTVADHLRQQTNVPLAMMRFNYRPGVALSDFVKFHGLSSSITKAMDTAPASSLPDHLATLGTGNGHPLFGSPTGMQYARHGQPATEALVDPATNIYGIYELVPEQGTGTTISKLRQQAARTIQRALERIITRG